MNPVANREGSGKEEWERKGIGRRLLRKRRKEEGRDGERSEHGGGKGFPWLPVLWGRGGEIGSHLPSETLFHRFFSSVLQITGKGIKFKVSWENAGKAK